MFKTIRKRTVRKTTLNFTPCFRRQRSVMPCVFGQIGEWLKISNMWAEFEEDFGKCWLYCVLYLLVIEGYKKSLQTDYENLVHVYLLGWGIYGPTRVWAGGLRENEIMEPETPGPRETIVIIKSIHSTLNPYILREGSERLLGIKISLSQHRVNTDISRGYLILQYCKGFYMTFRREIDL